MSNTRPPSKQIVLTPPDAESPVSMEFVHVPACPAGFLMGSRGYEENEEPIHRVVISEDFWLGETPVTQAQFDVWKQIVVIKHENDFSGHRDQPAENMNWWQSMQFCRWLTETHAGQFPSGFRFAELPCEARWEYACRAGTTTVFFTGDGNAALRESGWYAVNSKNQLHPVKSEKVANNFGLFDMHGNVWEWCLDRWDALAYRRRWDGIADRKSYELNENFCHQNRDNRVMRGGSFRSTAHWCRSACRFMDWAGVRGRGYGFRVCLVRSPYFSQTGSVLPERRALERRDDATGSGSVGATDEF